MKTISYILTIICLCSFADIPNNYLKKIDKEIQMLFEIESYDKTPVVLDASVLDQMSANFKPEFFFKIEKDGEQLGYFYFGKAPSKADEFDFVVIFDAEFIIRKIKILAYREDYGGEISSKRWLRQFDGSGKMDELKYGADIKGISGATISAKSMTHAVNELLSNISKLPTEH